jgi:hypothetical protein
MRHEAEFRSGGFDKVRYFDIDLCHGPAAKRLPIASLFEGLRDRRSNGLR